MYSTLDLSVISIAGDVMDVSSVSTFDFHDEPMREHFLMLNGLAHRTYFQALIALGFEPNDYPIFDLDSSKVGHEDWQNIHGLMHAQASDLLDLELPDLTDVDFNNANDFMSWLQLHQDAHIALDVALGV